MKPRALPSAITLAAVAIAAIAAIAASAASASPSAAASLGGVTVADTATVNGKTLTLNGLGLRKKFVVKVYVAGLYLTQKQADPAAILGADAERRGTMNFLHDVSKDKICDEGWKAGLAANTPGASAEVKTQFDTLCSYMEDMADGEALSFDYVPGTGTTVVVKGATKGTIPGKPFADALFACWIGPKPGPGEDFKASLLGGS